MRGVDHSCLVARTSRTAIVAARATIITARTTVIATRATTATTATRALRLRLRQFAGQGRAPGEAHLAVRSDVGHHHGYLFTQVHHILDLLDADRRILGKLRDKDEAIATRDQLDERAVRHDAHDLTGVDLAPLRLDLRRVLGQGEDLRLGLLDAITIRRGERGDALVLDVDLGVRLFLDLADHRAARADDLADLGRIDLDRHDLRRELRELGTRLRDRLHHLAEDELTAVMRLAQRLPHDLRRDALDLDIHLDGGDAVLGPGDLEVH